MKQAWRKAGGRSKNDPEQLDQDQAQKDKNGLYDPTHCNHYNLLKMIEKNWALRGLINKNTSKGYQYVGYRSNSGIGKSGLYFPSSFKKETQKLSEY